MIIGIAAIARYLGYRTPDSLRRARTRHPIPSETKPATAALLDPGAAQPAAQAEDRRQPR